MGDYLISRSNILRSLSVLISLSYLNCVPVLAETKVITLKSNSNQNFARFIKTAESLAKKSIVQEFKQAKVTTVNLKIIGERNGLEVPLLFTKVSRSDWQTEPKVQRWSQYFIKAAVLLGFNQPQNLNASKRVITNSSAKYNLVEDPGYRDD